MEISNKNITVAGSGYVGMSLAVLLAQTHKITIYDIDQKKVEKINSGTATIEDADIDKYFDAYKSNISAISDSKKAEINNKINNDKSNKINLLNIIFKFILS